MPDNNRASGLETDQLNHAFEELLNSFTGIHSLNKREFLDQALQRIFLLIPEARGGSLFELTGNTYFPVSCIGYDPDTLFQINFRTTETAFQINEDACDDLTPHSVVVDRTHQNLPLEKKLILQKLNTYQGKRVLYAPIVVEKRVRGMLCLDKPAEPDFTPTSFKILKYYAHLISEFYSQHFMEQKLSDTYLETVEALISAIELKDIHTSGHAHQVKGLSNSIGKALNLGTDQLRDLEMAALLHDVGKIGIPESILNKPERLTDAECAIVKTHPLHSKRIVEKISGFSHIVEVILYHHENYDGSGYPQGLKHPDIPLGSQIIRVADAYSALTNRRSYRDAYSPSEAAKIMRSYKGKLFNPQIVEIAIDCALS